MCRHVKCREVLVDSPDDERAMELRYVGGGVEAHTHLVELDIYLHELQYGLH